MLSARTRDPSATPASAVDRYLWVIFGVLFSLVVLLAVAAIVLAAIRWWPSGSGISTSLSEFALPGAQPTATVSGAYSAVFLTNDQVYFGKVTSALEDAFVTMEDVYYLQADESGQSSLARLGSEMHGPESTIKINRDQILFVETLRADSSVVKAIEQSKTAPQAAPQP